jgi:ferredoxin
VGRPRGGGAVLTDGRAKTKAGREAGREFVAGLVKEAEDKHLVVRSSRYAEDRPRTQGICFCCDDCCYYCRREEAAAECGKGRYIVRTAEKACAACGTCVEVCYFGARALEGDAVDDDKCYGCALCLDVCPEGCISMASRS